jgi:O-antigen/teichoic acid export membrane protein
VKRALRFGWKAHPGSIAEYALYRCDTYLVGYLGGFRELGYYAFAQPIAEVVWLLSISVRPILYAETSRSNADRASRLAARAVRFTLLLGFVLALGLFVLGIVLTHTVLPLYRPAVLVLAILLTATLSATIFQLILADLTSRGQGGTASRVSLIVFPFAVACYVLLVPRLGAIGAAYGSLIAYASQSALALRAYRRFTGMPIRKVFVFGPDDIADITGRLSRMLRRQGDESVPE